MGRRKEPCPRLDAAYSKTAAECHPGLPRWANRQPPARAAPSLVRALRDARGPSCSLPGQACSNAREGSFLHADHNRPRRRNGLKWEKILLPPAARLKNEERLSRSEQRTDYK